jgi:hypothetical protein
VQFLFGAGIIVGSAFEHQSNCGMLTMPHGDARPVPKP